MINYAIIMLLRFSRGSKTTYALTTSIKFQSVRNSKMTTKICTKCNCEKELSEFRLYKTDFIEVNVKNVKITKLIYRRSKRVFMFFTIL